MFIDYVGLMLINMAIGLVTMAWCVYRSADAPAERGWAAAFFAVSIPALACGFHMIFTWPLPGSYNTAYGELSVLLGTLFLAAGISTSAGSTALGSMSTRTRCCLPVTVARTTPPPAVPSRTAAASSSSTRCMFCCICRAIFWRLPKLIRIPSSVVRRAAHRSWPESATSRRGAQGPR